MGEPVPWGSFTRRRKDTKERQSQREFRSVSSHACTVSGQACLGPVCEGPSLRTWQRKTASSQAYQQSKTLLNRLSCDNSPAPTCRWRIGCRIVHHVGRELSGILHDSLKSRWADRGLYVDLKKRGDGSDSRSNDKD